MIRARLEHRRKPRRKHRIVQVAELVDACPDGQPDAIENDLVLHVGADLGPVLERRRNRHVEVVAPHVAAEADHVPRSQRDGVPGLEVVGLG